MPKTQTITRTRKKTLINRNTPIKTILKQSSMATKHKKKGITRSILSWEGFEDQRELLRKAAVKYFEADRTLPGFLN